jgi:hypothetical protein
MRMPIRREFYLADILAKNAATLAVLGGVLIGWHGWSSYLAKLAKHIAILAAHVNGTL